MKREFVFTPRSIVLGVILAFAGGVFLAAAFTVANDALMILAIALLAVGVGQITYVLQIAPREWLRFDENELVHGIGRRVLHQFPYRELKVSIPFSYRYYLLRCGEDQFKVGVNCVPQMEDFRRLLSEAVKDVLPVLPVVDGDRPHLPEGS